MNVQRQIPVTANSVVSSSSTERPEANNVVSMTDQQELQQLSQTIKGWRDLSKEVAGLSEQVREKKKRMKAMDEVILRIMKKHNIGALDLKESGGRILYKRSSSKEGLTPKNLMALLSTHLKSEQAAADALKYINEHRESKVKEKLLFEQ